MRHDSTPTVDAFTTSQHQSRSASAELRGRRFAAAVCAVLVLASVFQSPVFGQDDPPETPTVDPAKPNEPDTPENDAKAAIEPQADVAESAAVKTLEQLIYLPFKDLKQVFENQDASVVVPYSEYIKLWEEFLKRSQNTNSPVGVRAVITESTYEAKIENDLARIVAKFTIQVLEGTWVELPVQFGDAAVGRLSSGDDKVLIRGTGDGTYAIILPSKGAHQVELELVSRIHSSPEGRTFSLKVPSVGITTFELAVPEPDQTIDITPRSVAVPVEAGNMETRVKANLGATNEITVRWNPRAGLKPQMDLLASVTNLLHITIDEGLVHTSARLQYDVLRGELNELTFAVPQGHRILDVAAPNAKLRGWRSAEDGSLQLVTVELLAGIEKKVEIEVHTEHAVADATFAVAGIAADGTVSGIHAVNVVRESGFVAVSHGADLSLTIDDRQGLTRVDAAEVPASLQRGDALYYRFYNPSMRLAVTAQPVDPRIRINHTATLVFRDDELKLETALNYEIDRAGVFELRIQVPDGVTIENVTAEGMTEFNFAESTRTLIVSLAEKRQGDLLVEVSAHRDFTVATDTSELVLPILQPAGAAREDGTVLIYAPPAIEVITDQDQLVGVHPSRNAQDVTTWDDAALVSAWSFTRHPVTIPVRTVRKPTRLAAGIGTTIVVEPELTRVSTIIDYEIRNAGIDTFRVSVPESIADSIRIEAAASGVGSTAVKQKSRATEAVDGQVVWTIVMQDDVLGHQSFDIHYDLKPEGDLEAGAATVTVAPVQVLAPYDDAARAARVTLAQTVGEIAVQRDRALSVSAEGTGDDLEPIDVRELLMVEQEGAIAYRYYKQPVSVAITASKHEIQKIVQTVVSRAVVEIVIERDPIASSLCRYRITSSERQRLPIYLPAKVQMHEPLVDGRKTVLEANESAEPRDGFEAYYVNVARTTSSDEAFVLTLHYRAPITASDNRPFSGRGGSQLLRLPVIAEESGAVVQKLETVIHVPKDFALIGTPENFVGATRTRLLSLWPLRLHQHVDVDALHQWVGNCENGMVDFPRAGHAYQYSTLSSVDSLTVDWWDLPFVVWVLSGAVFLSALALRPTGWENKLGVVLIVAFVAALFALRPSGSDVVVHALAAASYGIIAGVAMWLICALFGSKTAKTHDPPDRHASLKNRPQSEPPGSGGSGAGSSGGGPGSSGSGTGSSGSGTGSSGSGTGSSGSGPAGTGFAGGGTLAPLLSGSGSAPAAVIPPPGAFDAIDQLMGRKGK